MSGDPTLIDKPPAAQAPDTPLTPRPSPTHPAARAEVESSNRSGSGGPGPGRGARRGLRGGSNRNTST